MPVDLILTIAHHLVVFSLVGLFAAEFTLLRPGLEGARIGQLARLDAAYGAVAGLVVVVGVLRVLFGAAGWEYYAATHAFWGKMGAFLIVRLLTIPPTLAIRQWQAAYRADTGFSPDAAAIRRNRRFLHIQAGFLLLIPIFAAIMARG